MTPKTTVWSWGTVGRYGPWRLRQHTDYECHFCSCRAELTSWVPSEPYQEAGRVDEEGDG